MILTKTKKGTEDIKLDNEYIYDRESYTSQSEFNQKFLDLIPTGTSSGDSIYINDSSDFPVKDIDVVGKTSQDTTSISGGDEYDSPSPQHPQTIHNVSGDVNITTSNKNLFDKLNVETSYLNRQGEKATSSSSVDWRTSDYIAIAPETSYVTSGMIRFAGQAPARCYYNINKEFISGVAHLGQNPFIDTSPANAYYMRESVHNLDLNTVMIAEGSTETPYEPHKGETVMFPLAEGQKFMTGDYLADDGIHHFMKQVVFDGTENWRVQSSSHTNILNTYVEITTRR